MVPLFPLNESMRGFFSDIHCENRVELLEVKLKKVWSHKIPPPLVPRGLTLRVVYTEPLSITFRFSSPPCLLHHTLLQMFCSWTVVSVSCESLFLPVSNFQDSSFSWAIFNSFMDLEKVVDFFHCVAFYLLVWSGDFQVLYMPVWKLEVLCQLLTITWGILLQMFKINLKIWLSVLKTFYVWS